MIVAGPAYPLGDRAGPHVFDLTSDTSVGELLDFARAIRVHWYWLDASWKHPRFRLPLRIRARALRAGARGVDRREYARAVQALREAIDR